MLQLSCSWICKPLKTVFELCFLKNDNFLQCRKKQNLSLFIKNNKKYINNYHIIISLLPICEKMFEHLFYISTFKFLIENHYFSKSQWGFRPSDSCINRLLSVSHDISKFLCFESFEIYQKRLIKSDIKDVSTKWNIWSSIKCLNQFSCLYKEMVVLSDQYYSQDNFEEGVVHGFILGQLMLFIYINSSILQSHLGHFLAQARKIKKNLL